MKTLYIVPFTHNMLSDIYKSFLDFFSGQFPRINWKVMGTYFKAVEFLNKKQQMGREVDMPMLPMMSLNPSGEFVIEEKYGRMFWRFPYLAPGLTSTMFTPIYQDQYVKITPNFTRLRGELEIAIGTASYYEYLDYKIFLNLLFGGLERYIYPEGFNIYIILPDNFKDLLYKNDVTGEQHPIIIPNTETKLIKTIAQNKLVYPGTVTPLFRLTAMSDNSTRLGGTNDIPSWTLGFTAEYEIEIPTQFIIESDYLLEHIDLDICLGLVYSKNSEYNQGTPPDEIKSFTANYDWHLNSTTDSTASDIPDFSLTKKNDREFKIRYYHIVTAEEADSTADIEISLPESITDKDLLMIIYPYGKMDYWDQYIIQDSGTTLILHVNKLILEKGQFLELYIYKYA